MYTRSEPLWNRDCQLEIRSRRREPDARRNIEQPVAAKHRRRTNLEHSNEPVTRADPLPTEARCEVGVQIDIDQYGSIRRGGQDGA